MMQLNKAIINKEMEEAMQNWQDKNTTITQERLYECFMTGPFLIPVEVEDEPIQQEDGTVMTEGRIRFPLIKAPDDKMFLMAFTNEEELGKWADGTKVNTTVFTFKDYVYMMDNNRNPGIAGIVINPFNQSITIFRELLLALNERKQMVEKGHVDVSFAPGTPVSFTEPKDYPVDMVMAVKAFMEEDERIKAGYLRVMGTDHHITYLIVVDFKGDETEIFNAIAERAKPHLKGMMLDITRMNSELGEKATTNVEAFYQVEEGHADTLA